MLHSLLRKALNQPEGAISSWCRNCAQIHNEHIAVKALWKSAASRVEWIWWTKQGPRSFSSFLRYIPLPCSFLLFTMQERRAGIVRTCERTNRCLFNLFTQSVVEWSRAWNWSFDVPAAHITAVFSIVDHSNLLNLGVLFEVLKNTSLMLRAPFHAMQRNHAALKHQKTTFTVSFLWWLNGTFMESSVHTLGEHLCPRSAQRTTSYSYHPALAFLILTSW